MEPIGLPTAIANPGTTVIVAKPILTNAGQVAAVTVTCEFWQRRGSAATRGDVDACAVVTRPKKGRVAVVTYGYPVKVRVVLTAPATSTYAAFVKERVYRSR